MIPLIVALVVVALYLVGFYNGLKTIQVQIAASIQEIGNQLKRQAELIPNLADSVKGYLKHEKSIFADLTAARKLIDQALTSKSPQSIDKAQTSLNKAIKSIQVVVESNPQIKGSEVVANLMNELRDTADKVMYSRRTFIDLSADFNVKITTVPGVWLAGLLGFKPEKGLATPATGEHLEVSASETTPPKISL